MSLWLAAILLAVVSFVWWRRRRRLYWRWHKSDSGNPTIRVPGARLTVFNSESGWKICVATENPLDDEEDSDGNPEYSEPFKSKRAAMRSAKKMIRDLKRKRR